MAHLTWGLFPILDFGNNFDSEFLEMTIGMQFRMVKVIFDPLTCVNSERKKSDFIITISKSCPLKYRSWYFYLVLPISLWSG